MKVVSLHNGRPSLDDIPGRLRWLADEIEIGSMKGSIAVATAVLTPTGVQAHGFGACESAMQTAGLLGTAQHILFGHLQGDV